MDISRLLNIFIICDIIFICSFCISGLEEYSSSPVIIGIIILSLLSYYPLYLYVKEYDSDTLVIKDKLWHYSKQNTCLVYALCRGATLFLFLAVGIMDTNEISLVESFQEFSFLTNVALLSMTTTMVILLILALIVLPYHRTIVLDNLNVININATIVYSKLAPTQPPVKNYNSLTSFDLNSAHRIWLTPDQTQEDHTFLITKFAQSDLIPMESR